MQSCCVRWADSTPCSDNYDHVQFWAVVLLYLQVVCSLIGSLGALYSGIVLANLALALFALVAIASGSQNLGRAYAALLVCALLVDIVWFILFTSEIRNFAKVSQLGKFGAFSVQLTFWIQATGCGLRFASLFLWIQIYRLGVEDDTASLYYPVEFEGRIGGFGLFSPDSPSPASRQLSGSNHILGGSLFNPPSFSAHTQFSRESSLGNETNTRRSGYLPPKLILVDRASNSTKSRASLHISGTSGWSSVGTASSNENDIKLGASLSMGLHRLEDACNEERKFFDTCTF